jgi:hypothetical protein
LIAKVVHAGPGGTHVPSRSSPSRKRAPIIIGVALSMLIHGLGLWLVIERNPIVVKPPPRDPIVVSLATEPNKEPIQPELPSAPKAGSAPARPASPPRAAPKKPAVRPKQKREPLVARNSSPPIAPPIAPQTTPDLSAPDVSPKQAPAQDDMFTQIEAARKRRAEAAAEQQASQAGKQGSQQEESARGNSIALANIARSLKNAQGARQDNSGGVFEVRELGSHRAEFMFYGWSANSRRNSTRLVTVEQGTEDDIRIAVVKKMIDIIRQEKSDSFVWQSHRLGRQLELSARPEDQAELQQFLIREFFPDYISPPRASRSGRG